jgi:hypothetical protein
MPSPVLWLPAARPGGGRTLPTAPAAAALRVLAICGPTALAQPDWFKTGPLPAAAARDSIVLPAVPTARRMLKRRVAWRVANRPGTSGRGR